ncbi:condensation domain-containing protein [Streptomyces sp. NPDC097595]|uniref:condensation domain-containing protein n=1 Tax=Streptomyces sp. NPDC097595 TaxID=3366090 RepID=UPI003801D478
MHADRTNPDAEKTRFAGGLERTGPLQSGIGQLEWVNYQSGGRGHHPNHEWAVPVPEGLSDEAVGGAVSDLLLRHEVLRTAFDADGEGAPQQRVHRNVLAPLPVVEDGEALRLFYESPFDVADEPPIRFGRTPEGELVAALAHIAADGMGGWILLTDLKELLAARAEGRAPALSAEAPQPIERAVYEREGGRPRVEAALKYWRTALQGFPVTAVPLSRSTPGADILRATLDSPAATQALAALQPKLSATPASLFTAAVYTALAVQFDRTRLGLSMTWSFREHPTTQDVAAAVFRDMPLICDLTGRPSFSEVLRRLERSLLLSGRHMGFDVLEFHECAGHVDAERGSALSGPEVVGSTIYGVDWDSVDRSGDPRDLLPKSQVVLERTNGFGDGCNLYISGYVEEGRVHLHSRFDASIPGAHDDAGFVTLVEAILVHASVSGDLAFEEAEALAADPWRPGARWALADSVWVDLDCVADRLRAHPAVRHAEVREEDGRVTAQVDTDLELWELRDHLLSADNGRGAVLSPHHFAVDRADGTTVAGSGMDRPMKAPAGAAEEALRKAVGAANHLTGPTMAGTYLAVGGRLHLAPRVFSLLRESGFEGLVVEDLRRPTSLSALARRLRPVPEERT